jgi:hypothetical protein
VGHFLSFAVLLENFVPYEGGICLFWYKLFKANPTYIPGSAFTLTGALHVTADIKLICADNIVTNPHSHWDQHWITIGIFRVYLLVECRGLNVEGEGNKSRARVKSRGRG